MRMSFCPLLVLPCWLSLSDTLNPSLSSLFLLSGDHSVQRLLCRACKSVKALSGRAHHKCELPHPLQPSGPFAFWLLAACLCFLLSLFPGSSSYKAKHPWNNPEELWAHVSAWDLHLCVTKRSRSSRLMCFHSMHWIRVACALPRAALLPFRTALVRLHQTSSCL